MVIRVKVEGCELMKRKSIKIQLKNYFSESKKIIKFSSHLLLANSIGYLNTHLDMLLIGYFLTDEKVGIYAVAVMLARFLLMIPQAIQRISYPLTAEQYGKKNIKQIEKLINILMRYTFVIISILGLITIFFGEFLIHLMYPRHTIFLNAFFPMVILIIGFSLYSISVSIGGTFTALGKPDITLKLRSLAVVGNILLNIYLIPIYGLIGGAIATAISVNISMCFNFYILKNKMDYRINFTWMIVGISSFIIIILIYFTFYNLINPYILSVILFGVYVIIIFVGKIVTQKDTHFFQKIILKK